MSEQTDSIFKAMCVGGNCYLIGPFAERVSYRSQQIRALNLVYALDSASPSKVYEKRVAVVGAGVAGMTASAALVACGANVTLFDQTKLGASFQANADHRYIHPNINFFPQEELEFTTDLPLMNWWADSSSKVVGVLLDRIANIAKIESNLKGRLDLRFIPRKVEKIYYENQNDNLCKVLIQDENNDDKFETLNGFNCIILCTGFSKENSMNYENEESKQKFVADTGYWEKKDTKVFGNRTGKVSVVVSGAGDGGVIDALKYSANWDGSKIHQIAMVAQKNLRELDQYQKIEDEKRIDLLKNISIKDIDRIDRHYIKTFIIDRNPSDSIGKRAPWHTFLLHKLSNKETSIIEVRNEEIKIQEDDVNKKIIYTIGGEKFLDETTLLLIRHGANHNLDLISDKNMIEIRAGENRVSKIVVNPQWDAGFWKSKIDEKDGAIFGTKNINLAETKKIFSRWMEQYQLAFESNDMFNITVCKDGELFAESLQGILPSMLPGLPNLFGLKIETKPRDTGGAGIGPG